MLAQLSSDVRKLAKTPKAGGSISIPFPFFSYSKSPEQQVRDSIVKADILRQLARIATRARARAKQDSLRRADSLTSKSPRSTSPF